MDSSLGSLVATLGVDASPLNRARDHLGKFVVGANRDLSLVDRATSSLTNTFKMLGGAIGAALVVRKVTEFSTKAVQEFGNLEQSLIKASTLFGDVDVDMGSLKSQTRMLSNEVGLYADMLGGALYQALSAGIPVTEDMAGAMEFMRDSSRLAKAGFTDISTAVEAGAKTMNAYGLGLDDIDQIHKVLINTQNRGITTVNDLGSRLALVTPVAASAGTSFEQVGAALGVMTAIGTPTAIAITYLKQAINEMSKQGTVAAKALGEAAKEAGYTETSFTALMKSGLDIGEVLALLSAYAEKSGRSVKDLFGSIEAGAGALQIVSNLEKFARNLAENFQDLDVVGDAYAKVIAALNEQVGLLKVNFTNLRGSIGEVLAPSVLVVVGHMRKWVERNQELLNQKMEVWAENLANATSFVVENMGAISRLIQGFALSTFIKWLGFATGGTMGFAGALKIATTAARGLGRALVYGLIIEGITTVITMYRDLNKEINETPLSWGVVARVAGDNLVNGLINAIRSLKFIPSLINDIIVQPIAAGLSEIFKWETWKKIISGNAADAMYDVAQATLLAAEGVFNNLGTEYAKLAGERVVKIASAGDFALWNAGRTLNGVPYAPPTVKTPEEDPDILPDIGMGVFDMDAYTATFTQLTAQYKSFQTQLVMMGKEGWEAQREQVRQWAESTYNELDLAGNMTTEMSALISNIAGIQFQIIDRQQAQDQIQSLTEAKKLLFDIKAETMAMQKGPKAFEDWQNLSEVNTQLSIMENILKQTAIDSETLKIFLAQYKEWLLQNKQAQDDLSKWQNTLDGIEGIFTSVFTSISNHIVDAMIEGKDAFESFGDVAKAILKDVLNQAIQLAIIQPLVTGIAGGIDAGVSAIFNAHGNAFGRSGIIPFAKGGVVSSPTIFPFANGGKVGVMGEAGEEGIFPLTRIGGDLGVRAVGVGGDSSVVVNIVNQGGALEVESQNQRRGADGELVIDVMVKSAIQRLDGSGQLDGVFSRHGASRVGGR